MTCRAAEEQIQDSLDGVPAQTERRRLESHLESCVACRRDWEAQRRLASLADRWISRSAALSDPGEDFTTQVLARLETSPRSSPLRLWLPLTATLLLLTAFAFFPGVSWPDAGLLARPLHGLPEWALVSFSELPHDTRNLLRLPQVVYVPAWTGTLLVIVLALNSVFCVYARHSAGRRSAS